MLRPFFSLVVTLFALLFLSRTFYRLIVFVKVICFSGNVIWSIAFERYCNTLKNK